MKAMVCESFGGPEVLAMREMPDPPPPGPGEVQVRIRARGVQYVDVLMLAGKYQFRPEPPFVGKRQHNRYPARAVILHRDIVLQFQLFLRFVKSTPLSLQPMQVEVISIQIIRRCLAKTRFSATVSTRSFIGVPVPWAFT